MMSVMASTSRGLHPRIWVSRVLEEYQRIGIQRGYTYRNLDGTKLKVKVMEPKFHERLELIKIKKASFIPQEVDVIEEYGVSRSFQRGGTSEATN